MGSIVLRAGGEFNLVARARRGVMQVDAAAPAAS